MQSDGRAWPDQVIDLATRVQYKARARAILWSIFAFFFFFGPVFLGIPIGLIGLVRGTLPPVDPWSALGGLLSVLLIGWPSTALAVHHFRAARTPDCYLRGGPDGLSLRAPGGLNWSCLWLKFNILQTCIPWKDVQASAMRIVNAVGEAYLMLKPVPTGRYAQTIRDSRDDFAFADLLWEPDNNAIYVNGIHFAEDVGEIAQRVNDLAAHYQVSQQVPSEGREA